MSAEIKATDLFKVMKRSGDYQDDDQIVNVIEEMRNDVEDGEDPEELLYDIGLEPDYVMDLL
jgi:benzoyl-CoA reductase/2-hydroxyglutaryl-CoA dehydratase subunit BcrC/BadD/HgdB